MSDEFTNPDLIDGNHKMLHYLTEEELRERYTQEEIDALLVRPIRIQDGKPQTADLKYADAEAQRTSEANEQDPRQIRKWHPKEDEFLRNTYMFLTDNTLALALNVPVSIVTARRRVLGLVKTRATTLEVIVWCNRDDFDKDMSEKFLTKARPDVSW